MRPTLQDLRWLTAGGADHRRPVPRPEGDGFVHEISCAHDPSHPDSLASGPHTVLLATDADGRAGALLADPPGLADLRFVQGQLVVAVWPHGTATRLGTLDLASGKTHVLLEHPNRVLGAPCASLQTGQVVFHGDVSRDGNATVALTAPFDGGGVEKLTERTGQVEQRPVWSPDGKTVAFEVLAKPGASESGIALFNARRRRTEILAMEPGAGCSHPEFLDDRHLCFARATADGRRELVVLDLRKKTLAPLVLDHPAIEPRPYRTKAGALHLVFAAQRSVQGNVARPGAPYDVVCAELRGL